MKKFFGTIWSLIKTSVSRTGIYAMHHKFITGMLVVLLIGAGYWGYTAYAASTGGTEYVLSSVTRAPLTVTVTGSGEVDAKDTLNVTPQGSASGQITELYVTPGETVKAGQLIAELDMTTAAQAVTSAKQDLESAQISYQQTLTSTGSSVTNDQTSLTTDQTTDLNALATNYTNLPTIMDGLDTTLHNLSTVPNHSAEENIDAYASLVGTSESQTYQKEVAADFTAAETSYEDTKAEYTNADTSNVSISQIEQLDTDTIATDNLIETALKDTLSYYNYVNDQLTSAKITTSTQLSTQIASLTSYQSTITSDDSSITNAQTSLINAQQTLAQDTQTSAGNSTPLTVQSAELSVQKAQEALDEAETTEADYEVRAPFDGVIGSVPVNQYDQASSGTTIATLITTDEYVDLSLNEADAAKVQVGQPVSITFSAFPSLTMTGSVATIDPVGTVSSGVVTYDVEISFSQQNSQIKPGMTANAVITTSSVASAIQVPSAAITTNGTTSTVKVATILNASSTLASLAKTNGTAGYTGTRRTRTASSTAGFGGYGGGSASSTGVGGGFASSTYAGMIGTTAMTTRSITLPASEVTIKTVPVTTGLSNDTMTQILTGLTPGEYIVTATQSATTATTKTAAASATSLLGGSTSRTGAGGFTGGAGGGGYTGARAGGGGASAAGAR